MDILPDTSTLAMPTIGIFTYIFPEYPAVGVVVCGVSALLFVFYMVKAGIKQGLKIGLVAFCGMSFALFVIHSLYKLFFAVV